MAAAGDRGTASNPMKVGGIDAVNLLSGMDIRFHESKYFGFKDGKYYIFTNGGIFNDRGPVSTRTNTNTTDGMPVKHVQLDDGTGKPILESMVTSAVSDHLLTAPAPAPAPDPAPARVPQAADCSELETAIKAFVKLVVGDVVSMGSTLDLISRASGTVTAHKEGSDSLLGKMGDLQRRAVPEDDLSAIAGSIKEVTGVANPFMPASNIKDSLGAMVTALKRQLGVDAGQEGITIISKISDLTTQPARAAGSLSQTQKDAVARISARITGREPILHSSTFDEAITQISRGIETTMSNFDRTKSIRTVIDEMGRDTNRLSGLADLNTISADLGGIGGLVAATANSMVRAIKDKVSELKGTSTSVPNRIQQLIDARGQLEVQNLDSDTSSEFRDLIASISGTAIARTDVRINVGVINDRLRTAIRNAKSELAPGAVTSGLSIVQLAKDLNNRLALCDVAKKNLPIEVEEHVSELDRLIGDGVRQGAPFPVDTAEYLTNLRARLLAIKMAGGPDTGHLVGLRATVTELRQKLDAATDQDEARRVNETTIFDTLRYLFGEVDVVTSAAARTQSTLSAIRSNIVTLASGRTGPLIAFTSTGEGIGLTNDYFTGIAQKWDAIRRDSLLHSIPLDGVSRVLTAIVDGATRAAGPGASDSLDRMITATGIPVGDIETTDWFVRYRSALQTIGMIASTQTADAIRAQRNAAYRDVLLAISTGAPPVDQAVDVINALAVMQRFRELLGRVTPSGNLQTLGFEVAGDGALAVGPSGVILRQITQRITATEKDYADVQVERGRLGEFVKDLLDGITGSFDGRAPRAIANFTSRGTYDAILASASQCQATSRDVLTAEATGSAISALEERLSALGVRGDIRSQTDIPARIGRLSDRIRVRVDELRAVVLSSAIMHDASREDSFPGLVSAMGRRSSVLYTALRNYLSIGAHVPTEDIISTQAAISSAAYDVLTDKLGGNNVVQRPTLAACFDLSLPSGELIQAMSPGRAGPDLVRRTLYSQARDTKLAPVVTVLRALDDVLGVTEQDVGFGVTQAKLDAVKAGLKATLGYANDKFDRDLSKLTEFVQAYADRADDMDQIIEVYEACGEDTTKADVEGLLATADVTSIDALAKAMTTKKLSCEELVRVIKRHTDKEGEDMTDWVTARLDEWSSLADSTVTVPDPGIRPVLSDSARYRRSFSIIRGLLSTGDSIAQSLGVAATMTSRSEIPVILQSLYAFYQSMLDRILDDRFPSHISANLNRAERVLSRMVTAMSETAGVLGAQRVDMRASVSGMEDMLMEIRERVSRLRELPGATDLLSLSAAEARSRTNRSELVVGATRMAAAVVTQLSTALDTAATTYDPSLIISAVSMAMQPVEAALDPGAATSSVPVSARYARISTRVVADLSMLESEVYSRHARCMPRHMPICPPVDACCPRPGLILRGCGGAGATGATDVEEELDAVATDRGMSGDDARAERVREREDAEKEAEKRDKEEAKEIEKGISVTKTAGIKRLKSLLKLLYNNLTRQLYAEASKEVKEVHKASKDAVEAEAEADILSATRSFDSVEDFEEAVEEIVGRALSKLTVAMGPASRSEPKAEVAEMLSSAVGLNAERDEALEEAIDVLDDDDDDE